MLVIGCTWVDADECWVNTSGGFGGGGMIPIGAGVGATTSGDFLAPPPKGPLDDNGTPNPCVATQSPPQSQCQGVGDTTGDGSTFSSCSEACTSTCPAAAIAGCSFRVDNPHESMHVPGTVNVVATVQCNRAVSGIEMTLGLARDGQEVTRSTFANSGKA